MRVGMISPYSLSVPGGVQNQILALGRALRKRGVYVRVLGPCDGPPPEPFVTPLGNSVPTGANGSVAPIAPDPAAQLRTMRALRDEEFDVLHLHEPMAPGPTMTAMLVKPAPIVATFHAAGSSRAYDIFKPFTSRGSHRIDLRVAVSPDAEMLARESLGGRYEIAFNGVDVDRFRTKPKRANLAPTAFFLARHEDRKGLDILLKAFEGLEGRCVLWVGGVGPETASLRARYQHETRIEWLGEIDENEKLSRMRQADVFCAPSLRGESFGIVLLEAMAAETAVLASDLSGYRKVVQFGTAGEAGELVPPGDVQELRRCLGQLLTDPAKRNELVQAGSSRVSGFAMARLADFYVETYNRVLRDGQQNLKSSEASLVRPRPIMKALRRPR